MNTIQTKMKECKLQYHQSEPIVDMIKSITENTNPNEDMELSDDLELLKTNY